MFTYISDIIKKNHNFLSKGDIISESKKKEICSVLQIALSSTESVHCANYAGTIFFWQIPNNNDKLKSDIKLPLLEFGAIKYLRYTCELLNFNSFLNDVSNCNAIQSVNNTNGQKCSDLKYGEHM